MSDRFHKPTKFSGAKFEGMIGGDDPAQVSRVAHETAQALLSRVRESADPGVVERVVAFTDENGIDAIAELWSRAHPHSLPGALWRIYLLRALIRGDAEGTAFLYQRGSEQLRTIDPIVAGAPTPTGPAEVMVLADQILRGAFAGDFAIALERAAAFCRVAGAGASSLADDSDPIDPERASELTTRALRFSTTAAELQTCARSWRNGALD